MGMNVGMDGDFSEIVNRTTNFVHGADFGDNLINDRIAFESVSRGVGITATVVGGLAATAEVAGTTLKWLGKTGRAASIVGLATLAADAYLEGSKKEQVSKTIKKW